MGKEITTPMQARWYNFRMAAWMKFTAVLTGVLMVASSCKVPYDPYNY